MMGKLVPKKPLTTQNWFIRILEKASRWKMGEGISSADDYLMSGLLFLVIIIIYCGHNATFLDGFLLLWPSRGCCHQVCHHHHQHWSKAEDKNKGWGQWLPTRELTWIAHILGFLTDLTLLPVGTQTHSTFPYLATSDYYRSSLDLR